MRKWEEKLYEKLFRFGSLLEIRKDYLKIVESASRHPSAWKAVERKEKEEEEYWLKRARLKGEVLKDYDPYTGLFDAIGKFQWLIGIIVALCSYLGLSYLVVFLYDEVLALAPLALFKFYLWLLRVNGSMYKYASRKLRFNEKEIHESQRRGLRKLFLVSIWNGALTRPRTLPVLQFLLILKYAFKNIYRVVIEGTSRFVYEYYEMGENRWGAIKVTSKWIMKEMRKPRQTESD
jgi:hypothetical protein